METQTNNYVDAIAAAPRPRILVADDEEPLLRLLEAKFVRAGFDVDTALDGQEAWEKVVDCSPNLVLTDYRMPGVDGLELCTRLLARPQTRRVPVLVMTTPWCKIGEQFRQMANVVDLIEKPPRPGDIIARARQLVTAQP
jgi:CheY-like chemotaxis protein